MSGFDLAASIAGGQHGVVARRQLLAAGVFARVIERALESGRLFPVYRGVYRVGHRAPSTDATYLACGQGAALSGLAAAHLLVVVRGSPPEPEVTAPKQKRVPGLKTKRCTSLGWRDVAKVRGIPVTTVPRTLVDLAPLLAPEDLALACHNAGVRYRTTPRDVARVLARRPNAPGAAKLRAIMSGDQRVLLSRLEARFIELLEEAGLPLPQTNRPAGAHYVDCRWPMHKLTVELDSYRFHNSRHSWEQDRKREREAYARGDGFRRYTWGDVFETPRATLGELCGILLR